MRRGPIHQNLSAGGASGVRHGIELIKSKVPFDAEHQIGIGIRIDQHLRMNLTNTGEGTRFWVKVSVMVGGPLLAKIISAQCAVIKILILRKGGDVVARSFQRRANLLCRLVIWILSQIIIQPRPRLFIIGWIV